MSGKVSRLAYLTALSLVALVPAAYAQNKTATPINAKVGYVNLALIKASTPAGAQSEELTQRAEQFLKASVEESNKRLAKAQEEKKSEEEIKKMKADLQTQIYAKQQAYHELVTSAAEEARQRISAAANQVAADKGLDLIVDGAGVLSGGQKLIDNGIDITQDVVKKLAPQTTASKEAPAKEATK